MKLSNKISLSKGKKRLVIVSALALCFIVLVLSILAPDIDDMERKIAESALTLPADASIHQKNYHDNQNLEFITETNIISGDSLYTALARMGIDDPELRAFVQKSEQAKGIFNLFAGRLLQANITAEGKVRWLRYMHTPSAEENNNIYTKFTEIKRTETGFSAQEMVVPTEKRVTGATGVITSSLFGATDKANVPDPIAIQIAETLATDIDFHKDLRKGDAFRVLYEIYTHEGQYVRSGRVLALEFINKNKKYEAVWFQADPTTKGGYYTLEGKQLRKSFRRSPLAFSRISSLFSRRLHPIFKTWRNHTGVDYAAPTGTPIMSTADGVVTFVGNRGGYGKTVIVKHFGQYSTLYAHMSRYGNYKVGSKVSQDDVIGYVGATGYATGPHLHYEFRINDVPVNPLTQVLPQPVALEGATLKKFFSNTETLRQQLSVLQQVGDSMIAAEKAKGQVKETATSQELDAETETPVTPVE